MKRTKHSLSKTHLMSGTMGALYPLGAPTEVLPGDSFQQNTSLLIRMSPMLAPIMHRVTARVHHWFVPHRLVWEDWENFITGGPDGMNASVVPYTAPIGGFSNGDLFDHMGVTPAVPNSRANMLAARGYNLIWNNFYRDQDLQPEQDVALSGGEDNLTPYQILPVCWEKDYFTTARPWAQKGPSVTIPFASDAIPVTRKSNASVWLTRRSGTNTGATDGNVNINSNNLRDGGNQLISLDPNGGLETNLSTAAGTIEQLRVAFALQRYEEARARYGSRYTEYLRYLGVQSSDARLQLPEYLGGGKQVIQFSEIVQTAPGDGEEDDAVGSMKGHSIGAMRSNRYRRFFEEHGYVFTLLSVLPKTIYGSGTERTFNRTTKEDFFQMELQHVGQQEILNKEIYTASASPNGTWGYQDRYDEYRRGLSTIAGQFRNTLNYWHMARIFGSAPTLNDAFVQCNPTNRVFASAVDDTVWVQANHSIQARRIVAGGASSYVR